MGGILTGLFINYKIKQKKKDKNEEKNKREIDHTNNISPIPTAPAYPVTPPMALNPDYVSNKPVTKLVFSTE